MPVPGNRPSLRRRRPGRHAGVDIVDERAESGIDAVSGLGQVHLDLGDDPAGIGRKHQDAVAHKHRFLDIVRDEQNGLDRHAAFAPEIEQVGAQRFRREHVQRGERLVHQEHFGIDHERAGEAYSLAHAARELLRIGGFEAIEADKVDRGKRALAALLRRNALRFEAQLDVLLHRQPGEKRKALEHHRKPAGRAFDCLAADVDLALARWHQPRNNA